MPAAPGRRVAAPRVRAATAADLMEVARLSRFAQKSAPEYDEATIARHLSAFLSAGGSIYLATDHNEVEGYVLCRRIEPLFYAVDRSVVLDLVFVEPSQRRRGIGHALMLAVATYAREAGASYIYATPSAADRTLQRFLATLGFAPLAGNRVVATSVLLRRLVREDPITQGIAIRKPRTPTRTSIDEVIAARKRARISDTAPVA